MCILYCCPTLSEPILCLLSIKIDLDLGCRCQQIRNLLQVDKRPHREKGECGALMAWLQYRSRGFCKLRCLRCDYRLVVCFRNAIYFAGE